MSGRNPRYQTFFAELKRRQVFKVAAVYGAVAFAVMQAADFLVPALRLPEAVATAIALVSILGFPVAVLLAWAFEMTPDGVRREDPAASGELEAIVAQPRGRRWPAGILALVGIVLLLGGGWWVLGRASGEAGAAAGRTRISAASVADERPSIAVLPFANLTGDAETQSFTDGIHDDVLTQLTKIGSLKVISRTSVLEYRNTRKNVRDIAGELGVATILEGGVQRAGDQVRINVQLIDARSDEHLWAERYNRDLTAANIFAIQTEIAEAISVALSATLTPEERENLAERPTESLEAYEDYRRGLDYVFSSRTDEATYRAAERFFSRAIELDPDFAQAYANLSIAYSLIYWFHYDRTDEIRRAALSAAERALEIEPGLAEGHEALGHYYYRFELDYSRALAELGLAERQRPGNSELQEVIASVLRRQGNFEGAVARFRRGVELDPRSPLVIIGLGETLQLLRRFDEAEPHLRRAIELAPDDANGYTDLAWNVLLSRGDIGAARRALDEGREAGAIAANDALYYRLAYFERDVATARALLDVAEDPLFDNQFEIVPKALGYAELLTHAGNGEEARAYYNSARAELRARLGAATDDPRVHSALGITYAGLGRHDRAVQAGEFAVRLMSPEREAWRGVSRVYDLARIYARVGRQDDAIDLLEDILARPANVTEHLLRLDPAWDPLRHHPRFAALVDG